MEGEYYKTKETVEEYIRLAKEVSGKELIEKLMKVLPAQSEVLEIGSGPGTDWKILNESFKVTGSDNSSEFLKHLKRTNPKGEFLALDANTLKTNKKFDGIYSNKVMHHLNDKELIDSVQRQYKILNATGIICHSFWKGEDSEIFKGLFVNYHNEVSIQEVFQDFFKILSIEYYKEFDDDDSLLLLAIKK